MKTQLIVTFTACVFIIIAGFSSITADYTTTTSSIQEEYSHPFHVVLMDDSLSPEDVQEPSQRSPVICAETPDSFNWRQHEGFDWTTPAKHQGNCGSCWDFAAIGTLESIIKITENNPHINPDLSEQYVLSCLPAAANNYGQGCMGGTPYHAFYYMMNSSSEGNNVNGAIPEDCFPYQADDQIPCSEKCEQWVDCLIPIADCGEQWLGFDSQSARDTIKNLIYQQGPIAAGIDVTDHFVQYFSYHHRETDVYPDTHETWQNRLNHIIVIIGWVDDASFENGGYWICKNSWGTDWGYDGYFNIEYGGLFVGAYIAWVEYQIYNNRPQKPMSPNGPTSGSINTHYNYSTSTIDLDGDDIYYLFDFGDGSSTNWIGPVTSNTEISASHQWEKKGSYAIRVKAKDTHGYETEWSDPLSVSFPKSKAEHWYKTIFVMHPFLNRFISLLD